MRPDKLLAAQDPASVVEDGLLGYHQTQDGNVLKLLPTEAQSIGMHTPMVPMRLNPKAEETFDILRGSLDTMFETSPEEEPKPIPDYEIIKYESPGLLQQLVDSNVGKLITKSQKASFHAAYNTFNAALLGAPFGTVNLVLNKIDPEYAQKFNTMMGVDTTAGVVGDMVGLTFGFGKMVKAAKWAGAGIYGAIEGSAMASQLARAGALASKLPGAGLVAGRSPYAITAGTQYALFNTFKNDQNEIDLNPKRLASDVALGAAVDVVLTGGLRGVGGVISKYGPQTFKRTTDFLGFTGRPTPFEGAAQTSAIGGAIGGVIGAGEGAFGDDKDLGFFGRATNIASKAGGGGIKGAAAGFGARLAINHLRPNGWENLVNLYNIPFSGALLGGGSQLGLEIFDDELGVNLGNVASAAAGGQAFKAGARKFAGKVPEFAGITKNLVNIATDEVERLGSRFGLKGGQFSKMYSQAKQVESGEPEMMVGKVIVNNIDDAVRANQVSPATVTTEQVANSTKQRVGVLNEQINTNRVNIFAATEGTKYSDMRTLRKTTYEAIDQADMPVEAKKAAKKTFDKITTNQSKSPTISHEEYLNLVETDEMTLGILSKYSRTIEKALSSQATSPAKTLDYILKSAPNMTEVERNVIRNFIGATDQASGLATAARKSLVGTTLDDIKRAFDASGLRLSYNQHGSLTATKTVTSGVEQTLEKLPSILGKYIPKTPKEAVPYIDRFVDKLKLGPVDSEHVKKIVHSLVKDGWQHRLDKARYAATQSKDPLFLKSVEGMQDRVRGLIDQMDAYTSPAEREGLSVLLNTLKRERTFWAKSIKGKGFADALRENDRLIVERDINKTILQSYDKVKDQPFTPPTLKVPGAFGSGSLKYAMFLNLANNIIKAVTPKTITAQQTFNKNMSERMKDWAVRTPKQMASNPMDNGKVPYFLKSSVIKEHVLKKQIETMLTPGGQMVSPVIPAAIFDLDEQYKVPISEGDL